MGKCRVYGGDWRTMSILRKQYNDILAREKKAEEFFKNASPEEVEKWLPEYTKIIIKLSKLMEEYTKLTGKNMTSNEIFNGFNIKS